MNKSELLENIAINAKIAKDLRLIARDDMKLSETKKALKHFQIERIKKTHSDLLNDRDTKEAALFFLNEIYSCKDLINRDRDLEKLLPLIGKMFPENTLEVIADAMVLDGLTEQLETKIALKLGNNFTEEDYLKAYREETSYEERLEQLNLVKKLGDNLCKLVHIPLIATTLKLMKFPAKIANLEEMHDFLNTGFQTFQKTKDPQMFIDTLVEREKKILEKIMKRLTR